MLAVSFSIDLAKCEINTHIRHPIPLCPFVIFPFSLPHCAMIIEGGMGIWWWGRGEGVECPLQKKRVGIRAVLGSDLSSGSAPELGAGAKN